MSNGATSRLLSSTFARLGIAAAVVGLGWIYWSARAPGGYDLALAGGPYVVGEKDVTRVVWAPIEGRQIDPAHVQELPRETVTSDGGSTMTRVRLPASGDVAVDISVQGGAPVHRNVHVEPVRRLVWSALLFLVIALLVPYGLASSPTGTAVNLWSPWYALLSEAGGGYSLARVQLLIWFLPTAVLYAALSFTLEAFSDINGQIAVLIGLSGATTLLGTAATPPKADRSADSVAPDLGDLVTDWNSHGDLSRYQYLLLSIAGAVVMVAAFWRQLELPNIPSQFLYLLAGSQGTYIGTKALKTAKAADTGASATGAPPLAGGAATRAPTAPVPAPATFTPAPAGTATAEGSFQPAGK